MWNLRQQAYALTVGLCAAAVGGGLAGAAEVSGEYNGIKWSAASTLVGVGPTGEGSFVIPPSPVVRLGPGGDSTYLPDPGRHSGTVSLIMNYGAGGAFICSGSLLRDRASIATAGHCVSSGGGVRDAALVSTTAYFWDYSTLGDERVPFNPQAVAIDVTQYYVNPEYTGEVIDQNDIAVLRLGEKAPDFAQSYELFGGSDLTGQTFNVAGYGGRSAIGGDAGVSELSSTGFLREGDNRYDWRMGDADFDTGTPDGSVWNAILDGFHGELDYSYVSDFDNGTLDNDTSCLIAYFGLGLPPTGKYCNGGVGAREVGVAGGDSGGPGFIGGKLASINSYGLTFGTDFGDVDEDLNSSFGEFSGYVPIYIHRAWINSLVPEPGTWALLIAGFGIVGSTFRRRAASSAA